jgi:hypothetical protein
MTKFMGVTIEAGGLALNTFGLDIEVKFNSFKL